MMLTTKTFSSYEEFIAWCVAHNDYAWGVLPTNDGKVHVYRMTLVDAIKFGREGTD